MAHMQADSDQEERVEAVVDGDLDWVMWEREMDAISGDLKWLVRHGIF